MDKKFCINCGEELEDGAKFCWKCGTEQRAATCPSCGQQIKENWKVCPFCRAALSTDMQAAILDGSKNAPSVGSIIDFGDYDWRVLDVKNGKALLIA
jgi:predicted amidophosphoribosyltransferase